MLSVIYSKRTHSTIENTFYSKITHSTVTRYILHEQNTFYKKPRHNALLS